MVTQSSELGLTLRCHHLKILNVFFKQRVLYFHFCPGPYKLWNQGWLQTQECMAEVGGGQDHWKRGMQRKEKLRHWTINVWTETAKELDRNKTGDGNSELGAKAWRDESQ